MKKSAIVISVVLILTLLFSQGTALAYTPTFEVTAPNVCLMNLDTGYVLYQKGEEERIAPASTCFLMVALVTADNVSDWSGTVTIHKHDSDSLLGTGALVSNLKDGEEVTVEQLLNFLLVASYNDVALYLANRVAGSVDTFVGLMNEKAAELGMDGTQYVTPVGLTTEGQYTTVKDMMKLGKATFANEAILTLMSKSRYTVPATNLSEERILPNTNYMVDNYTNYYYKKLVAGKTGNGDEGRCLISEATYNGETYLCTVARCPSDARQEIQDTKNLYEWAFDNFRYKTVLTKGDLVDISVPVNFSWDVDEMTLCAGDTVTALLPKDADLSTVEYRETLSESYDAPIKEGDVLGTAEVVFAGERVGVVQLVASRTVEGSFVLRVWHFLSEVFGNWIVRAALIAAVVVFIVLTIVLNVRAKRARDKKLRLKKRL
ncbi:MAG: D-alanyl-D-alanine carboxypeptidase [Clostridia bacterium]|nr:D-alanyl-D-alanine carboxypeptidase [Clostridia bacterium]